MITNKFQPLYLLVIAIVYLWPTVYSRHCYYRSLYRSSYQENGTLCNRLPQSCNEVPRPCVGNTATHVIDPDGPSGQNPPVKVDCDFSTSPPSHVIHHNMEERFHVNGYEEKYSYVAQPTYSVPFAALTAFIDSAHECEQYFRYECHHSIISDQLSLWKKRDGAAIDKYMPGGDPAIGGCSCYKTRSCAGGGKCNCAKNDHIWRFDDGVLKTKSDLPIVSMQYGDTGHHKEEGYSTIGPVKCFFEKTSTSQIVVELVAVGKVLRNQQSRKVILKHGTCLWVCFQDPNCQSFSTYKDENGNTVCETSACDGRSSLLAEDTGFYYVVLFRY